MRLIPSTTSSVTATVSGTAAAAASALIDGIIYLFTSTTACWIRQGTSKLVTCIAKASMVDGETLTITVNGTAVVYEFDVNGTGVTAGRVQVNISDVGIATAANVAATLRTAIIANQTTIVVTDPANGTLFIDLPGSRGLTVVEAVADAGFTVGNGTVQATAGAGSMLVPAGVQVLIDGDHGGQVGVIQDVAGGKTSIAYARVY